MSQVEHDYYFAQDVPWGDGPPKKAGSLVPMGEQGRDYNLMERVGLIVKVPRVVETAMGDQDKAGGPSAPATGLEEERARGDRGLVTTVPPVPVVEEALAGVVDVDHAGTGNPRPEDLEGLQQARAAEQEAAAKVERPLSADEQAERGQRPAVQPDEQTAQQAAGAAPQDAHAAEERGPVTGEAAAHDAASRQARDQAPASPTPGKAAAPLVGPGSGEEAKAKAGGDHPSPKDGKPKAGGDHAKAKGSNAKPGKAAKGGAG